MKGPYSRLQHPVSNPPDPFVAHGMGRRRLDDEEGTVSEVRRGLVKFLVRVHKSPNPAKKVVLRRKCIVRYPVVGL